MGYVGIIYGYSNRRNINSSISPYDLFGGGKLFNYSIK